MKTIQGIFVSFSDKEEKEIMAEFLELGYEWNGAGIKKFLVDALFNQEEPEPEKELKDVLSEALRRNPSAPLNAIDLGLAIVNRVRENFRQKK